MTKSTKKVESLCQITHSEDKKLIEVRNGVAYFEDGWWMLDSDRRELEVRRNSFQIPRVKANKDTKQIEIDNTIFP